MPKRKWVLVLMLVLLVLNVGGYGLWKITGTDDKIRRSLLEKAGPFLAAGSGIHELKLTPSRAHLKGVVFIPRDSSLVVEVEDIRLGINLWNLVRYGFRPTKAAHDVVLVRPVVRLTPRSFRRERNRAPGDSTGSPGEPGILSGLKRVTVADGILEYDSGRGRPAALARSLNGILSPQGPDSMFLRLEGSLFSARRPNLILSGALDPATGGPLELHLKVEETDPSSNLSSLLPGFAEVEAGNFKADCRFQRGRGLTGYMSYSEGRFSMKRAPLRFSGVQWYGVFKDWGLVFSGTAASFNGSRLGFGGYVENLLDPEVNVSATASRLDLGRFLATAYPESRPVSAGRASFSVRVTGRPGNPEVRGDLEAEDLDASGLRFGRLGARVGVRDSVLSFSAEAEQAGGLTLSGRASVDFRTARRLSDIRFSVLGDAAPSLPGFLRRSLARAGCEGELRLSGPLGDLKGEASAVLGLDSGPAQALRIHSNLFFVGGKCLVTVRGGPDFRLNGEINGPFRKDPSWFMRFQGLGRVASVFSGGPWVQNPDSSDTAGRFEGAAGKWDGELATKAGGVEIFSARFSGRKRDRLRTQADLSAQWTGRDGSVLPCRVQAALGPSGAVIQRMELGDFLTGSMRIPAGVGGRPWEGSFTLQNFRPEKLHGVFPPVRPFRGKWNGLLKVGQAGSVPSFRLDLSLREGVFRGEGVFAGDLSAGWRTGRLDWFNLSVQKDKLPFLVGNARTLPGDSLTGKVQSGTLNLAALARAAGVQARIQGEAFFEARLSGSPGTPVLRAEASAGEGALGPVAFKRFRAVLEDTLMAAGRWQAGALVLAESEWAREDGFSAGAMGRIPHDPALGMDVTVSARGNLLGWLPEAAEDVRKADCPGEAVLRFAGRPGSPRLARASLRVDRGAMDFASVMEPVREIRIEAVMADGDSILRIQRGSFSVRGQAVSLSNRHPEGALGRQSLVFRKPGLNLGVLYIGTPPKGIPIHLPGLMAEGERGWIGFSGKGREGAFSVSGPVSAPLLEGTLFVNNTPLTYPFLETGDGSGGGGMTRLLESIRWKVRVVPRKDVHYVRELESPAGNVFVDLKLQDGVGGLSIEGRLDDDTFEVFGGLVSSEGALELLDRPFRPERITFEYPKGGSPIFSGRAHTTVVDSTGTPSRIWMDLVSVDTETGIEGKEGPWSKVQFRFSTDNPDLGRSEADLLAAIGYSESSMKSRAYDALGMQVENRVFRPLFKPIERGIRRYLGFDMVRFSSMFSRNLAEARSAETPAFDPILLLRSSKVTLGRSFGPGFMLVYAGEVQNEYRYLYPLHGLGLRHALALEYAIQPELMLGLEYTYDSQLLYRRREDKRIWLKHVFPF